MSPLWVVSAPEAVRDEADLLNDILDARPDALLLRKPGWSMQEYTRLLAQLRHRDRIMIAGRPALLADYGCMGVHISEAARNDGQAPPEGCAVCSTSIHMAEAPDGAWNYLLLGPLFHSISKAGYAGRGAALLPPPANTIAIGGIGADNIQEVRPMGFCGAALLGTIWQDPHKALRRYLQIRRLWDHMP
ncbi:thiamine phosphate synthase [Chitinophaga lutea]